MTFPPRTPARYLTGVLLLFSAITAPLADEQTIDFDIPEQALSDSLLEYSEVSGVRILLNENLARGLLSPSLSGRYTPKAGLNALLDGSGLNYYFTSPNAVVINGPEPESLSTEMLMAKAPKENYPTAPEADRPYTGPVEQMDMTVRGGDWSRYAVSHAKSATKTDSLLLDTPASIEVIPRTVLDDQQTITVSEGLRNVSGVVPRVPVITPNFEPTLIRGFPARQMIDGFTQFRNAGDQGSLVNIERIEVVKGANAVLYSGGRGAPVGGMVNLISKLPKREAFYEVGIKTGSYDFVQPYVDLNQPFNDNILFRFTGEYTNNESHIDVLETDRYNFNPTLTVTDNDATTFTLQGKFSRWEQQDYQGLPAVGTVAGDFRIRPELFIGPDDIDNSNSEFYGVWTTLDHRLNEIWSITAKLRYSHSEFDTLAQNTFGGDGIGANEPLIPPSTWWLLNSELAQEQEEKSVQVYTTAKFDLGPSDNSLLLGADFSELDDDGFMDFAFLGAVVDLANPGFSVPYSFPGARQFNQFTRNTTYGGYLQLQSTIYDRFHVMTGVRIGHVTTDFKNTLTGARFKSEVDRFLPNVGALIDIVDGLSVFANYSEGMRGQSGVNFVSAPNPELSNQIEVGLKFDVADRLTGQIAAYEIERENIAVTDVTDSQLRSIAKGQQRSRGIETNLTWQATEGLNLLATYTFTKAEFTDSLAGVPKGNDLPGVPKHSGRFWANYAFQDALLKGLSIGAGLYAQSSAYLSKENLYKSDSFYTMDASINYQADAYKLGLSVKNLTDEDYFQRLNYFGTRVSPTQGTAVYFSGSIKF